MPPKKEGNDNIREQYFNEQMIREKKLSSWLWIGVGGLGFLIIFFWGYSIWANLTSFNWKKSEETKILEQTNTNWDQAFQINKQNQIKEEFEKLKIKELLNQALRQQERNISVTTTITTSTLTTTSNR